MASAKGGVGKSTIAVNLAIAFAARGLRSGILDTDIYGPSIPRLLQLQGTPELSADNQLLPLTNYGVKSMSMGFLVPESTPIVWRGLMVMKALQQLLHEVEWGGLDVLILDLPPGTGDVQLSISQQVILDGAIIVSTPQDIAMIDAIRGINMFKKVDVPLLGLIENMAYFDCPNCAERTAIFDAGQSSLPEGIRVIGKIPLDPKICSDADKGQPSMIKARSPQASVFRQLANELADSIGPCG